MTELKTLKDIEQPTSWGRGGNMVWSDDLRKEAIKWVKDCIEKSWEMDEYYWIEFFNLTDEELK